MSSSVRNHTATPRAFRGREPGERGHALIEFSFVLPLLVIVIMATIDFGHLVQTRLIITNVSREGGSIASRTMQLDAGLTDLLASSGNPLLLGGADGKIYVSRITAGQTDTDPAPTITTQLTNGSLSVNSRVQSNSPSLGLSQVLYDHLVFNPANGTADIKDITVVEIFYKYRPITPLAGFIPGMLRDDGDGLIVGSRAIF